VLLSSAAPSPAPAPSPFPPPRAATAPAVSTGGIDFSVQVLTMGWWPNFAKVSLALPRAMAGCQEAFEAYYASSKQHRRLQWVHAAGGATVKATYGKAAYEFQVVTLQAVCLLLFAEREGGAPVPFEAVKEGLNCDAEVVKRTLHSLSCGKIKVLNKTPADAASISPTDTFEVNAAFTAQLRRLRIPMASLEESHNPKRVEEDRSHTIEACIVRIMKARKSLGHQQLMSECIAQLHFFKVAPKVIKKRIEHLIEREYLERDAADPNVYKYMA
jgi:cullin 1